MPAFSPDLERVLALALAEAQRTHSHVLGTPHLFIGLTKLDGVTTAGLRTQGRDPKRVRDAIRARLGSGDAASGQEPVPTSRARANLKRTKVLAEWVNVSVEELERVTSSMTEC